MSSPRSIDINALSADNSSKADGDNDNTPKKDVEYAVILLNVNGLNDDGKRRQVCNKILKDRPDIAVLVDTRLSKDNQQDMIKRTDYHCFFANNPRRCKGIAVLIKNTTDCTVINVTDEDNSIDEKYKDYVSMKKRICEKNNDN